MAMAQSTLRIVLADGGELRFGAVDRRILEFRAEELRAAGMEGARYYIDGEELPYGDAERHAKRTAEPPAPPEPASAADLEGDILDVEVMTPEPAEPAEPASPSPAPAPPPTAPQRANDYQDAVNCVELANRILQNSALVAQQMLDAAARRSSEQAADMAKLQTQQVRDSLETGAALQGFVGKMNADLAEERLAAFQIRRQEDLIKERESQRRYDEARALHDANRPSTGIVILELASHFAANFARNAAENYSVMNGQRTPSEKG